MLGVLLRQVSKELRRALQVAQLAIKAAAAAVNGAIAFFATPVGWVVAANC